MEEKAKSTRRHEDLYRLLIEAATGYAIITLDRGGRIASWNTGARRLLGYEEAEALGMPAEVIFTEAERAAGEPARELDDAARFGQAEDERWHVRKDGSRFFATGMVFPLKDDDGAIDGFVKILRDNTERQLAMEASQRAQRERERREQEQSGRRDAEAALIQSRGDFRMLMDSITEYAIMLLDREGRVVDWNVGAAQMLGHAQAEVAGRHFSFFFTPEDCRNDGPQQELETARSQGRSVDDKWYVRRNGERFFANGMVQPMLDRDGRLRGYAKIMRDATAHRLAEEQTAYLANHDVLTGLPNRTSFSSRLHQELAAARRGRQMLALLLLDLDRFKYINDTLGHHAGDQLLQEVARRLLACVRGTDMVARLGGDEFVVIQTGLKKEEDAGVLAHKIAHELSQPYSLDGAEIYSGASIGITVFPKDADNPVQLLKNADIAMYRAKSLRNTGVEFFTETLSTAVQARKNLEDQLRSAIRSEQLEIHYQPQIDLESWQVTGVEALLRWKTAERQAISVSELIGVAEENGSIVEIGKWVLTHACRQLRAWHDAGLPHFHIAVNLSPLQFRDPTFLDMVRAALREADLGADCIELEITERLLMENTAASSSTLRELKRMGVMISVDDFGTGYSALSYLRDFPIDVIKIDRSLVQHLPNNRQDVAIASSIISLAQNLGIKVVAEGVESTEQLAFLKTQNCTSAQGFLFQPPIPAAQLEALMRDGHWSHMNPI